MSNISSISLEELIKDSAQRIVNGHTDRFGRSHYYQRGVSSEMTNLIPIVKTLLMNEVSQLRLLKELKEQIEGSVT